jgi:UDP-N-acetylmuramate dehydrogenase
VSEHTSRILAPLTTLRLGGPAPRIVDATGEHELIAATVAADDASEPLLLIGGGSNLVIADAGFPGTVVRILTHGIETHDRDDVGDHDGDVEVRVSAGEPWDGVVAETVAAGLRGLECLSGIPGSTGATPIQNVGAYGASVADVISSVRVFDRRKQQIVELSPAECGFGYRASRFKHDDLDRYLVLSVAFLLERAATSAPIRYAELARRLGVELGDGAPLQAVRDTVLELRRSKGMVLDPDDPDSVSAGSFFTNPILAADRFQTLVDTVAARLGSDVAPPSWPEVDGRIKTSAAWLIERAGFTRGYGTGSVGLSSRHTLAIINRGGATSAELVELARTIQRGVRDAFGVTLQPEPTLVGISL